MIATNTSASSGSIGTVNDDCGPSANASAKSELPAFTVRVSAIVVPVPLPLTQAS